MGLQDFDDRKEAEPVNLVKRLTALIAAVILIMGVSGCMEKNEVSAVERMVAHLNDRYDDTFAYAEPFGGGAGANSKQIICSSEKYPGAQVVVTLYRDADGLEHIADNYMGVKYEARTRSALEEILEDTFGVEYRLFYQVSLTHCTEGASNEMSFESYASQRSSGIGFTAVVDSSYAVDRAQVESALEQAFRDAGICCTQAVVYFNGGQLALEEIRADMITGYLTKEQYAHRLEILMDSTEGFASVKWR